MKKTLQLTVIAALLAMGVTKTNAATTIPKTLWVSSLSFNLTAFQDGSDRGTRITSKDIIAKLNGLQIITGTNTNTLNFSTSAKLLLVQDTTITNDNNTFIVVRDGKPAKDTEVDVDNILFFDTDSDDTLTVRTTSVSKTVKRTNNVFGCNANGLSFNVDGFTETTDGPASASGTTTTVTKKAAADVSGQGTFSTADVVLHGTVSVGGGRLEAPLP